jgi:Methyltransferase domain
MGQYKDLILEENQTGENNLYTALINDYAERNPDLVKIKCIEIGVLNGDTTKVLLQAHPNVYVAGIDPIIPDSMASGLVGSLDQIKNNTEWAAPRFAHLQDYSHLDRVVTRFEDNTIDYIFIDGDHNYNAVKTDLEKYFPKIKVGGIITIHDSRMYRGGANFWPGPSQLVKELTDGTNPLGLRLEVVGETWAVTAFIKK